MLSIIWTAMTWIFRITLGYYALWLIAAVCGAIFGISSRWCSRAAPALGRDETEKGLDGALNGISMGAYLTIRGGWVVMLYQLIYIIIWAVMKIAG